MFVGTLAVLHVIRPSRGKAVVQALFGEIRPMVWVSDMLGSQRGHAVEWQVCLAHLLRDARYAVECGDTAFSAPFKRLLLRAIAIGRRRDTLKDITLKHYLADLDRRLNRIMAAVPLGEAGRKLRKRIAANRAHLFVFITNYQQRLRAPCPPQRGLPQVDQRFPQRVGRRDLCRIPLSHRKGQPRFGARCSAPRACRKHSRAATAQTGVSNYVPGDAAVIGHQPARRSRSGTIVLRSRRQQDLAG